MPESESQKARRLAGLCPSALELADGLAVMGEHGIPERKPQPSPFQFASVVLRAIRRFPDAYHAIIRALGLFRPTPTLDAPSLKAVPLPISPV